MEKEKLKKQKKNQVIKWMLIVMAGLLIFGGFKYFSFKSQMDERRAEMQEQRQVMIDFYKDQGLSDEEIEEKMKEERGGINQGERSRNPLFMIRGVMGGSGTPRR
jgi:flagellar basal body-associated protein FliL